MPTSRAFDGWRSLHRQVTPSSDVFCRRAGTAKFRLQPVGSYREAIDLHDQGRPSALPVKDVRPTTQDAFHRVSDTASHPAARASRVIIIDSLRGSCTRSPFIHQRSRQRSVVSFRLGRVHSTRLATCRVPTTRDASRPMSATLNTHYEHPRLVGSRSVTEPFDSLPIRGSLRFHDALSASAGRVAYLRGGRCLPLSASPRPRAMWPSL